jgi:hypothetical protein
LLLLLGLDATAPSRRSERSTKILPRKQGVGMMHSWLSAADRSLAQTHVAGDRDRSIDQRRGAMAKGQLRSNKEAKKPKKEKPKIVAAAPSVKEVTASKKK